MNTLDTYEQAQGKLAAYRLEADIRRRLPRKMWRTELARALRTAAEQLEPTRTVPAS